MTRKSPKDLRSARWFAPDDLRSFGHRSRMNQIGYDVSEFAGKPVIGIINTWSDFAQCHAHFKHRVEDVKRGVLQAGGFPVELPAISLSESTVKPTTMLYRNFLAMETEELIRSQPVDGVVLMGGCDKTTPGLDPRRHQRGRAGDLRAGRADAARQLARQGARLGLGRLEVLGRAARRQHLDQGLGGDGARHRAQLRRVHDHGYGIDHDRACRRAGAVPAGHLVDPGRQFQPRAHVLGGGAAHRSTWFGRI